MLQDTPDWKRINTSMKILHEEFSFDANTHSSAVFSQYAYIQAYCTHDKLAEWRTCQLPTEKRWVEIFTHMQTENVPFEQFSRIIEFILCIPGSAAPVERILKKAKSMWGQESSPLHVSMLDPIFHVKYNIKWSCSYFYRFLSTQPEMLRDISRQPKHDSTQSESDQFDIPAAMIMELDEYDVDE